MSITFSLADMAHHVPTISAWYLPCLLFDFHCDGGGVGPGGVGDFSVGDVTDAQTFGIGFHISTDA